MVASLMVRFYDRDGDVESIARRYPLFLDDSAASWDTPTHTLQGRAAGWLLPGEDAA